MASLKPASAREFISDMISAAACCVPAARGDVTQNVHLLSQPSWTFIKARVRPTVAPVDSPISGVLLKSGVVRTRGVNDVRQTIFLTVWDYTDVRAYIL